MSIYRKRHRAVHPELSLALPPPQWAYCTARDKASSPRRTLTIPLELTAPFLSIQTAALGSASTSSGATSPRLDTRRLQQSNETSAQPRVGAHPGSRPGRRHRTAQPYPTSGSRGTRRPCLRHRPLLQPTSPGCCHRAGRWGAHQYRRRMGDHHRIQRRQRADHRRLGIGRRRLWHPHARHTGSHARPHTPRSPLRVTPCRPPILIDDGP